MHIHINESEKIVVHALSLVWLLARKVHVGGGRPEWWEAQKSVVCVCDMWWNKRHVVPLLLISWTWWWERNAHGCTCYTVLSFNPPPTQSHTQLGLQLWCPNSKVIKRGPRLALPYIIPYVIVISFICSLWLYIKMYYLLT